MVNYDVRADVIDIANDNPRKSDKIMVDTNIWYWMTYTNASMAENPPRPYQTTRYDQYVNAALNVGAQLFYSGLSLAELSHLIEKVQREIYERTNGRIGTKDFRHNHPNERTGVVAEVQSAYAQIGSLAAILPVTIDTQSTHAALERLKTEKVDGYDLSILETMKSNGVNQIITDDGDFATVLDIQVFTANHNVINAARMHSKFIRR